MYNFASIVQKLMFFFWVKCIDEGNILILKNNTIVKMKRSKIEDERFSTFIYAFGNKNFILQDNIG